MGSTRAGLQEILATYRAQNIHRIVALRGDQPSGTATAGEFRYAAELVRFIRESQGNDWQIEVAAYPEYHPEQRYARRDLQHYVEQSTEGLVQSLRAGDTKSRAYRQTQVKAAIRFCEVLFGQDYASLMSRAAENAVAGERKSSERKAIRNG